jgi:hypothetical protein
MLGVRPYPEPIEGLTEYLLRLAYVNGHFKISELLHAINMNQPKRSNFSKWTHNQISSVNVALGEALNRDIEHVTQLYGKNNHKDWLKMKNRTLHELVVDFPRICASCVKEDKVLDWRWSIATIARCNKHKVTLLDTCPHCNKPLQWDANIFEFCTFCKTPWCDDSDDFNSIELSPLESMLWPDISGKLSLDNEIIDDVCLAIYMMARPFDVMISPFHRVPYTANHSVLVLKALQVLENERHRELWIDKCKERWHEYWDVLNPTMQFNHQVNNTNNDASFLGLVDFEECARYIKLIRSKATGKSDNPIFHVNDKILAETVNICFDDIMLLFEKHIFVNINKPYSSTYKTLDKKIFNLHSIMKLVTPLVKESIPLGFQTVRPNSSHLSRNLTKYAELLKAVISKEIEGYFTYRYDLSTVYVNPKQFKKWLNKNLNKTCFNKLPINDVATALSCSTTIIKRLVRSKQLNWAQLENKGDFIDGVSFKCYLDRIKDDLHWLTIMD